MTFATKFGALVLGVVCVSCTTVGSGAGESAPRRSVHDESVLTPGKGENALRKRIVVLPFLDADPLRSSEFRERSRQAFMINVNRTKDVLAIDSSEIKTDPAKWLEKNEYRLKDAAAAARNLGVSAVLEGKILELKVRRQGDKVGIVRHLTTGFEAVVRMRMVNVPGGREIFNTTKTVNVERDNVRVAERVDSDKFIADNPELLVSIVKDAFLDFTPQIAGALEKLTWEGRIAAISGDRIYLNVGKISGLQIGDLLKVSQEGDDVYDPESGGHIGRVPGRLKGTLEVISYFGTDGSIAIVHSGAGFKENDRVEIYQ